MEFGGSLMWVDNIKINFDEIGWVSMDRKEDSSEHGNTFVVP
jgi:hypothetical protein